jgi:O-antigen ligase
MNNTATSRTLSPTAPRDTQAKEVRFTFPLILLSLYIFVEYGRPPFLAPLHPALILQFILFMLLINNFDRVTTVLRDTYFKLYLIMLIEMMIHGPIAVNNYWAFQTFLQMLSYLIFGISFCLFIDDIRKLRIIITAFVIVHALGAISRMLNSGALGGTGPLGEKNDFGLAMVVAIPLSYYMGLFYGGKKRLAFWTATVVFVMSNVTTMSRGAFLGMVSIGILIWLKSKSKTKAFLLACLIAITFISVMSKDYKSEILSIDTQGAEYGTGRDRIELWKLAWKMFLDNPLLGVGQGNIPWRIGEYQYSKSGDSFWQRGMGGRVTHSIYFTVIPELGIVGFLLWLLMLRNIFFKYRFVTGIFPKNKRSSIENRETDFLKVMILGLAMSIVGYLVSGAFLSAFYYPQFWNLAALTTCAYMIKSKSESTQLKKIKII